MPIYLKQSPPAFDDRADKSSYNREFLAGLRVRNVLIFAFNYGIISFNAFQHTLDQAAGANIRR